MPRARTRQLNLNNADVDVVENAHWGIARDDFAVYRKVIRREMLWDWWPQEVSEKLQQFYQDLKDGKRPKVAIMAPPQHGKSTAATDFITWVAGKNPDLKTIFASFSDQLGERTNKEVQRIMRSDAYIKIFGRTRLDIPGWDDVDLVANGAVENAVGGHQFHAVLLALAHQADHGFERFHGVFGRRQGQRFAIRGSADRTGGRPAWRSRRLTLPEWHEARRAVRRCGRSTVATLPALGWPDVYYLHCGLSWRAPRTPPPTFVLVK